MKPHFRLLKAQPQRLSFMPLAANVCLIIFGALPMNRILLLLALPLLSACAFSPTEGIMHERVVRAGGADVVIAGPAGFCIDERLVDEAGAGAFVFLSDCASNPDTSGPTIARVPISAVLTASVSNNGLPGSEAGMVAALSDLKSFLETPFGQLTLSKSHNPNTLTVLSIERDNTAVYAFVEDLTQTTRTGESPRFWRAFTEVGGRLVAISATGYNASDPDQERVKRIIEAFVESLHAAN